MVRTFALMLNFFLFSMEVDIVRSNINILIQEGLGSRAEDDYLLARDACLALIKLVPSDKVSLCFHEHALETSNM